MKNENMSRDHGQKNLYFTDVKTCARFVNMYRDLFVSDWFKVIELDTTRGKVFRLVFQMKHSDMDNIRKVLNTKKRSFGDKNGRKPYRVTREFVEA